MAIWLHMLQISDVEHMFLSLAKWDLLTNHLFDDWNFRFLSEWMINTEVTMTGRMLHFSKTGISYSQLILFDK